MASGAILHVEATALSAEEDVAYGVLSFDGVLEAIEGIAAAVTETFDRVKPRKASIEFAIEVGVDSGRLTALLVKGTGKANLKINLEWGSEPQ
jgi:hypothetical protein